MDVEQFVGQCWDVLHGEGTPLEGCLLEESDAQAEAQRRFPGKPYCLVRQWSRIDLECEPETLAYFARVGLRAAVISPLRWYSIAPAAAYQAAGSVALMR